jgi:hypothetical protein
VKSDYNVRALAEELVASNPEYFASEDLPFLRSELIRYCRTIVIDRANDIRLDVQARLLRKKTRGVPFTAAEREEAARYGVRP